MKLVKITNKRVVKDEAAQVIASPTRGIIKVTEPAANLIGVADGDRVEMARDEEGTLFIFASTNEEEGLGQKLASTSKSGGGTMTFSTANGWLELEGSEDHNVHYDLGEAVESDGVSYFPLTFAEKVEKQGRKSSGDDTNEDTRTEQAQSVEEDSPFQL